MRPKHRAPLPEGNALLIAVNQLLERHALPKCDSLNTDGIDPDTYNPVVAGVAGKRRYAIKLKVRFAPTMEADLRIANELARITGLPIPAHLCCAKPEDPFPLLVMEWAAGSSFKKLIPILPLEYVRGFFFEWGACMARYHRAPITGLEPQQPSDVQQWWRSVANGPLRVLPWSDTQRSAIEQYLAPRLAALSEWAVPGLIKADDEPHDVLVLGSPPQISALIDWERIQLGDTACSVCVVYLRLRLLGLAAIWPDFLAGYKSVAGRIPLQCPQVECVLMCRALRAAESNPDAAALVDELLAGKRLLFAIE